MRSVTISFGLIAIVSKVSGFIQHSRSNVLLRNSLDDQTARFSAPQPTRTETQLSALNKNSTESHIIVEKDLLAVDFFGIILGSQLIGLLDVLNDSNFWAQGGFNQPIPAVPTTLGTFVQRTSIVMISWILGNLLTEGFSRVALPNDRSAFAEQLLNGSLAFVVMRYATAGAIFFTTGANIDALEIVRECYFTVILVGTLRYIYGVYIN